MNSVNPIRRRVLFSCIPLVIVLSGILYISTLPDPPHPDDISRYLGGIPLNDKFGHLVMFFGLGFLISNFLGYLLEFKGPKNVALSTGLAFLVGVIHEVNQYVVGRGYEIDDLIFDLLGGFLGAVSWHILIAIKDGSSKTKRQKQG